MKAVLTFIVLFFTASLFAQPIYHSFQFSQKLNEEIYSPDSRRHSSLKPSFTDSMVTRPSTLFRKIDSSRAGWISKKLFSEHLIDIKNSDYTAYLDFLPDFLIGKAGGNTTWLNTRGYQVGGTIGRKFSFYTSGYENQGKFAEYYQQYVNRTNIIPGQTYDRKRQSDIKDWSYVTALLSYTPSKYLNVVIGQDKNFIGDGYRSMILSDISSNYSFLKLTANLGNVQYMAMWAAMQEPSAAKFSYDAGNRKKGGVFHYLDWNITNRLSLGFFDAIIWAQYDEEGNQRGFDWGYANPFIFLRPLEAFSGSPDNAVIGLTSKYELLRKTAVYGQFLLDEFEAKNFFSRSGSYRNKWGIQLGLRGADLFTVNNLDYLMEYNSAKPHTYSSRTSILSYSHYSEPLAHPYGANFKETICMLTYTWKRFDLSSKLNLSKYGLDQSVNDNYGKDVFKPYSTATKQNDLFIGQGITTNLIYFENRLSFLMNPRTNLRFELGGIFRNEKNEFVNDKTNWLTFGLRSSFRNLYQDF